MLNWQDADSQIYKGAVARFVVALAVLEIASLDLNAGILDVFEKSASKFLCPVVLRCL